jgi:4-amino-4-deoxy-L-arabinose transferase-like glycosyltransferase
MEYAGEVLAGLAACAVFFVVGRLILSATTTHRETLAFQLRLFGIALLLRFLCSIAIYQLGLSAILGDYDSIGWLYGSQLRTEWEYAGVGLIDLPSLWRGVFTGNETLGFSPHLGYYYLLGTVFFLVGGASRMVAATLNCFLGAVTAVFAYRTARTLFSEWTAVRVGWWTCLFPSMIIWSAQTIKEPVVILLEVMALYGCVRLKKSGFAPKYILLCGLATVFVTPFRFYAAYIGVAAVILSLLTPSIKRGRMAVGSLVAVVLFVIALVVSTGALATGESTIEQFDIDFIQKFRRDIAAGSGSGVDLDVDMRTTTGFSIATAIGAAHLLLAPFPWQLGGASLRMLLTLPELVYWWWLFFVGVIPGMSFCIRRRLTDIQPLLVFVFGLGLLYSMTFGNIGVVFRQRAQLLPWLFVFAGVGLELRARRAEQRRLARLLSRVAVRAPVPPPLFPQAVDPIGS